MPIVWSPLPTGLIPGVMHAREMYGTATAVATEIPGLMDVLTPDGRELRDVGMSQLKSLAWREGWFIEFSQT